MQTVVQRARISRFRLGFALFGGAFAWMMHLMLAYAAAEFGCSSHLGGRDYRGISIVAWLELILTGVTSVVAGAATAIAYGLHRELRNEHGEESATARKAAWVGLTSSGAFLFIILFESIPIFFYLRGC
jgi:hypothetical protein